MPLIFNPDPPNTNDPNYLGNSQTPKQMEGNRQWEALFKGVGNVLDAGLRATDTVVKATIEDTVNEGVDQMRNAYTNVLERVRGTPEQERVSQDPQATSTTQSLLPSSTTPPPAELAGVNSYVANLHNAFLEGNISKTHYEGTLARFAKSVRDKFPGWRDYVDQEVGQAISQSKPANQYIEGLISDMNRSLTHNRSDQEKYWAVVKENPGWAEGPRMAQLAISGQIDRGTFYGEYSKFKGPIQRAEHTRTMLGLKSDLDKDKSTVAERDATDVVVGIAASGLSSLTAANGVSTPQQAAEYQAKIASGQVPDTRTIENSILQITTAKAAAAQRMREELMKRDPVTGDSFARTLGTEKMNKLIADSTKIYDDIRDMYTNKEYGAAFSVARINSAMIDQVTAKLYADPNIGNFMQKSKVIAGMGSNALETFIRATMDANPRFRTQLSDAFLAEAVEAASGTNPSTLPRRIAAAQARGINSGDYNAALIGQVDLIISPKQNDTVKTNIAREAFAETGLIAKLPTADAQYSFFRRMSNSEMSKEILRLSKLPGNEDLWSKYESWVQQTGAKELLPREIARLNQLSDFKGLSVAWDEANDRLRIIPTGGSRTGSLSNNTFALGTAEIRDAARIEDRINQVLTSVKPIAETRGANVDSYLIASLITMGFDPTNMDMRSLPSQIMKAIKENKLRKQKPARPAEDTTATGTGGGGGY